MARKLVNTKEISHEEWLRLRRKSLGGSDAGVCVGMNQYSSLITLYADKKELSSPTGDNEAMRLGRDLEQYVADRFMEATGKKLVNDNFFYLDDEYDFISANVDRKVVGENAGFEAKTMGSFSGYNIEAGEIPSHYYCQCQHYCMVRGWDCVYIGILVLQRGFYWHRIQRDNDFIKSLREAEIDFWTNYIEKNVIPPADGSDASMDTLKELYGEKAVKDSEIAIPGLDQMIRDYKAMADMEKEYKERKAAIQGKICTILGSNEVGIGNDFGCSWKPQSKSTYDMDAIFAAFPNENFDKFKKTSTYRVFRTKQMKKK